MTTYGLLDTSAVIAWEQRHIGDLDGIPDQVAISVVTLGELQLGIYAARDTEIRAQRMGTLDWVSGFETLDADADAATEWSRLTYRLREQGRRINVNDLWIASIALAHGLPVVTQDDDFGVLEDLGGPVVIRV
ncbi:MAG: type II toxin-antitoxin system VapC family toxin [Pseudolysinimonas sp.]|uniref:type II toxin-antitoxin system VapC family toxin n=1 Tax=Pseudolysinimonas sp. TaxID=2680009 RepID=UPI00326589E1